MVGEIRDQGKPAQIAIQSALTGHLVFNDCSRQQRHRRHRSVSINMGRRAVQFRFPALNCILAQRLVRVVLHELQAAEKRLTADEMREAGPSSPKEWADVTLAEGAGLSRMFGHRISRPHGNLRNCWTSPTASAR